MSPGQNRLRLLAVLFVGFNWMLDLVAVRLLLIGEINFAKPLLLGAVFAQVGLLGAWLVNHRGKIVVRTILAVASAAVLAQPLARYSPLPDKQWWGVFVAFLACVGGGAWLMRNSRLLCLFKTSAGGQARSQMSIAGIFAVTTCTAIGLAIAPHVEMPSAIGILLGVSLALVFLGAWRIALAPRGSSLLVGVACCLAATVVWLRSDLAVTTFLVAAVTQISIILLAGVLLRMAACGHAGEIHDTRRFPASDAPGA